MGPDRQTHDERSHGVQQEYYFHDADTLMFALLLSGSTKLLEVWSARR